MNQSQPSLPFDLDAYASRYHGRGKIQRLCFIAERTPESALNAYRAAVNEAKKGRDSALYKQIVTAAKTSLGDKIEDIDSAWVRNVDQWAAKQLEKLRHELEENKQNENKEVIRTGHNDLGDFFRQRGRLQQARGEYIKTRDYCMHAAHNLEMCLKVITVSIESSDYAHVESHFMIAENVPDVDKTGSEMAKMRACTGLAVLSRGDYAQAASLFLRTNLSPQEERVAVLQRDFGDIMALEDVVIYGGLCALATMDRASLSRQVVNKPEFLNLLELVPDMREIILDFYHTRYTRCLSTLDKIRPELLLDIHLGSDNHVDTLYKMIRRKAIMQYVSPFVTADLTRMQSVFKTTAHELEDELLTLIESGDISARIDTQHHALHANNVDIRSNALRSSIQKGREAFHDAEAMLLRMTLLKNRLEINVAGSAGSFNRGPPLGTRGPSFNSVVESMYDGQYRN